MTNPGYDAVKALRHRYRLKLIEQAGGKCSVCGYDKCSRALVFHHRDPGTKSFSLSANMNRAWSKLEAEAEKCDLLCSNCHLELHYALDNGTVSPRSDKA